MIHHTPWTKEEVAELKRYQKSGYVHPYTCINDSKDILIPTPEGWLCPHCDYRQTWFHSTSLHAVAAMENYKDYIEGLLHENSQIDKPR
jgi:hypothetical protein